MINIVDENRYVKILAQNLRSLLYTTVVVNYLAVIIPLKIKFMNTLKTLFCEFNSFCQTMSSRV